MTAANVTTSGFVPAATGMVRTYGKTSTSISSTSVTGFGTQFTIVAAPYSLTTVTLHARREHGGRERFDGRPSVYGRAVSATQ